MKIDKGIENRRFARREGDGIQNKQALLNGTLLLIYAQSWRNVNIYTELRYGTATVDLNRAASRFWQLWNCRKGRQRGHVYALRLTQRKTLQNNGVRIAVRSFMLLVESDRREFGQIYHSHPPATATPQDQRRWVSTRTERARGGAQLNGCQFRQVYSSFSLL